jgi:predicted peptidase
MKRSIRARILLLCPVTMGLVLCITPILFYQFRSYVQASAEQVMSHLSPASQRCAISTATPTTSAAPTPTATLPGSYFGFTACIFVDQGHALIYYLYIPANYNSAKKYPLVLLLQGGGERSKSNYTATQNEKLLLNDSYAQVWSADYKAPGNPHIQQRWPAFVVIPQIPLSQQWVNVNVHAGTYKQPAQPSVPLLLTKELLDDLQRQYSGIDSNRLYITGLSNGGYGTWDAIERWPNYFAAAVPIAGAGDPSKAAVLKNLPIWAFQGTADSIVPISGSRDMIAAIRAAGGHPKYTEFAGQSHEVWPYVYSLGVSPLNVTDFFPWLFSQHR